MQPLPLPCGVERDVAQLCVYGIDGGQAKLGLQQRQVLQATEAV